MAQSGYSISNRTGQPDCDAAGASSLIGADDIAPLGKGFAIALNLPGAGVAGALS